MKTLAKTMLALSLVLAGAAAAAAPAMAAPDFNGVWRNLSGPYLTPRQPAGRKQTPPYNAEYQAIYDKRWQAHARGQAIDDPTLECQPEGMPRTMIMPRPMEISQIPERMNIYSEWNMTTRRIHLDGRQFPEDPDPTYYGYSIGKWQGDVLTVETRALRDDTLLDGSGLPHSDAMVIKERIYLASRNVLRDEITIEDPKAFTRPWTVVREYSRAPRLDLQEHVCLEGLKK